MYGMEVDESASHVQQMVVSSDSCNGDDRRTVNSSVPQLPRSDAEAQDDDKPSTTTDRLDSKSIRQVSPPSDEVCSSSGASCITDGLNNQQHSYIALISMAILESPDKRLVLGDIYHSLSLMIPSRYNNTSRAWRNSIRHNLSLNECFVKAGRAPNGKGNYWTIHPACVEDFARGDYRRRQARRRAAEGSGGKKSCVSAIDNRCQGHGQNHARVNLKTIGRPPQQIEDVSEFVRMSCVTVLTGFNNSLTPAEIVGMLPPPWDVFSSAHVSRSNTSGSSL